MPTCRPTTLRSLTYAAAAALVAAACFGPQRSAAPEGLAYGEPDPNPAAYTFRDRATLDVRVPGLEPLEVVTTREGTAELEFRRGPGGFRVQLRFPRLEARFRDVMGETASAGRAELGGPLGLEVGYRGSFEVVDTPAVDARLLEITDLVGLVRPFIASLPGRPVARGEAWTDTLRTRSEEAGTETLATFITRSTLLGDTVIAGRRLLRIGTETAMESRLSGVAGGVEVEQALSGRLVGQVLWDEDARLLVQRVEDGELEGTLSMPAAGVDAIPLSGEVRREVSLRR